MAISNGQEEGEDRTFREHGGSSPMGAIHGFVVFVCLSLCALYRLFVSMIVIPQDISSFFFLF